jgi:hypothetical protein
VHTFRFDWHSVYSLYIASVPSVCNKTKDTVSNLHRNIRKWICVSVTVAWSPGSVATDQVRGPIVREEA